jgi:hypothetical protein
MADRTSEDAARAAWQDVEEALARHMAARGWGYLTIGAVRGGQAWVMSHDGSPGLQSVLLEQLQQRIDDVARERDRLRIALEASLTLQAHYAELLNAWDGGTRRLFPTVEQWLARLVETGTVPR